ncbi:MAG: insulinase family protein [Abitibacteriaceae bacterium]|nr:insulinase family protein [Abditibacteriaceae bacterium]
MNNSEFSKTTLPNGLRILTERHPQVQSATIGMWIVAGSIYEQENERGLAHLLEHMVFKGTRHRTMHDIAVTMDSIGGQMNAFTEREYVCYHAKVLSEHTPIALELLCDLVTSPLLKKSDLELEKGVILEEIKSVEDAPEELVEDLFMQTIWSRSRWGRSILGTLESVSNLGVKDLRSFIQTHYTPRNVVVVAVGDVQHDDIVERAQLLLKGLPRETPGASHRQPRQPTVTAHNIVMERDTEQVHLCCGTQAYRFDDPKRFAAWTLDTILTGGYSSRLFQEIREKRGLCYNIGPLSASYRAAGFWAVETSVALENAACVVDLIGEELRRVKQEGVTQDELKRAQQMARANILLSEESSSAQMSRIARNELYFGRQKSTAEVLNEMMAVSLNGIHEVANEMFDEHFMNLTAIGPFADGQAALQVDVG